MTSKMANGDVEQHPAETVVYTIETNPNGSGTPSGVALRAYDKSDYSAASPTTLTSGVSGTVISVTLGGITNATAYAIECEYTKGANVLVDRFDVACENRRA